MKNWVVEVWLGNTHVDVYDKTFWTRKGAERYADEKNRRSHKDLVYFPVKLV